MTELLNVYTEIYKPQLEYCVICFRSGNERRMVSLHNLKKFAKSINLPFNYCREFQRACWVCERAALAAFRVRVALDLSSSIHGLFTFMDGGAWNVAEQLRGNKKPVGIVSNAAEWQTRLEEVRARTQLLHTEVLVVASLPSDTQQRQQPAAGPASPPHDSPVYLIPDAPPSPVRASPPPLHDALSEPEIYMESVIIEDDERDPIEIKYEEPGPDEFIVEAPAPLDSRMTTLPSHTKRADAAQAPTSKVSSIVPIDKLINNTDSASFLLHPIVENNGVMSVPSLNAQIVNGQLMTVSESNMIIQTPKLALHHGANLKLVTEPNEVTNFLKGMKKNDSNTSGATKIALVNNSQSIVNYNTSNVSNTATEDMKNLMLEKSLQNRDLTRSIIIDEDDDDDDNNIIEHENIIRTGDKRQNGVDSRKKRDRDKVDGGPPNKQKETDWEDKIPMDVISYMDATDPHAVNELRGTSSLGVISSVQSVTDEAHSSRETNIRTDNLQEINSVQARANQGQAGINSVQARANLGQAGINSVQARANLEQAGINSVQARVNLGQAGINSVQARANLGQAGINSVQARANLGQAGINKVQPGINSVQGVNSGPSGENILLNFLKSDQSVNSGVQSNSARRVVGASAAPAAASSAGGRMTCAPPASSGKQKNTRAVRRVVRVVSSSVHQNVFMACAHDGPEVIDLC